MFSYKSIGSTLCVTTQEGEESEDQTAPGKPSEGGAVPGQQACDGGQSALSGCGGQNRHCFISVLHSGPEQHTVFKQLHNTIQFNLIIPGPWRMNQIDFDYSVILL